MQIIILVLAAIILVPTVRNQFIQYILAFLTVALSAMAFAQIGFVEQWAAQNLSQYFVSTGALGAFIVGAVEHIRQKWLPVHGNQVLWLVFIVGVGTALVGHFIGLTPNKSLIDSIVFGLGGAVAAYLTVNTGRAATRQSQVKAKEEVREIG